MLKKCKVVMLPTNQKSKIHKQNIKDKELYFFNPERISLINSPEPTTAQHFYIYCLMMRLRKVIGYIPE